MCVKTLTQRCCQCLPHTQLERVFTASGKLPVSQAPTKLLLYQGSDEFTTIPVSQAPSQVCFKLNFQLELELVIPVDRDSECLAGILPGILLCLPGY